MVTIKDVARRANVSFTTVSHVINKTRPVSPETAIRVQEAIVDLGYLPSEVARSLKSNRTRTIGMIVTTTSNPFFGEVIRGVERACFEAGYALMICNTDDVTEHLVAYMQTLFAKRVDAVIVMTSNASPEFFGRLGQIKRVPVVAIDAPSGSVASVVSDDSFLGGRIVADFLMDGGFTRIACVSGPVEHPRMKDRLEGFASALRTRGLALEPALLCRTALTIEGGRDAARRLLEATPEQRPQAIFALSDIMAIGLLHGIRELGLTIPEDVSVVGYDDIEFAAYTFPPLTTVRQPAADLGAAAAHSVMNHLDHDLPLPPTVALHPTLIVRQSVRTGGPGRS
ncbi:LacI family DNA-binding transcriptional regulator [Arvimicrobium flavum]|uniref:LacI family DNA-binding transcriptional regulator n=1 Tax=Arvimicrobium flavum TaxID=3393320 RepID=UPI00237A9A6D|nr:LacI family DNA-binding transcriptional regulator [Mesorhizobium shangrilense]